MRTGLSIGVEIALVAWLVLWMPRAGAARMRLVAEELRARPFDESIQVGVSVRFLRRWWPLALLCAATLLVDGAGFSGAPLRTIDDSEGNPILMGSGGAIVASAAVGIAISLGLLWRVPGYRAKAAAQLARLQHAWVLFPRSTRAALWFVPVALTAGIGEELAFRRLLPVLVTHLGGGGLVAPWLLSTVAFGIAHRYQGVRGMVLTGGLGLIFYLVCAVTGTLWPAMCIHALIDLRVAGTYFAMGRVAMPIPPAQPDR